MCELLPCPFCNGNACLFIEEEEGIYNQIIISCESCEANIFYRYKRYLKDIETRKKYLINEWNTRIIQPTKEVN